MASRALAGRVGFSGTDQVLIATAVSEIARNIVEYARGGEVLISSLAGRRKGLEIIFLDEGPGIADLASALEDGFTTSRGLGMGLSGARRLMDQFDIASRAGPGNRREDEEMAVMNQIGSFVPAEITIPDRRYVWVRPARRERTGDYVPCQAR